MLFIVLLSRQYVEISRGRIEGLITAFNRLIVDILKNETERQDTTIETESVRYLYQILDNITIVIITSKGSNVLEDLNTLSICAKVVGAYCRGGMQERDIVTNFIDIVFAFDQIVTPFGYKDNNHLTLGQIKSIVEMDSHDEKLAELNEEAKMRAAKSLARQKAAEFKEARDRAMKAGIAGRSISSADIAPYPSSAGFPAASQGIPAASAAAPAPAAPVSYTSSASGAGSAQQGRPTGLVLGMKKPQNSLLSKIKEEEQLQNNILTSGPASASEAAAVESSTAASEAQIDDLHIIVNEGVSISALSDGSIQSLEVKGDLSVLASTPAAASALIAVEGQDPAYQWKAHPQIDKGRWAGEGVLVGRRPFPVGSPIAVLKWHVAAAGAAVNESDIPLGVSCWPSPAPEGGMTVSIEYDMREGVKELDNVVVEIPCGGSVVRIEQFDGEDAQVVEGNVLWRIGKVSAQNASGSIEFEAPQINDSKELFPVNVRFDSVVPFSGIRMAGARMSADDDTEVKYSQQINVKVVKYTIEDSNQ